MKLLAFSASVALLLVSTTAIADPRVSLDLLPASPPSPKPYCILSGKAYSEGAFVCYGKYIAFECKDGSWNRTSTAPGNPDAPAPSPRPVIDICSGAPTAFP
jgi:hypothetical protein